MLWKKIGLRDLQLVEISDEERERIQTILSRMCDPSHGLAEAQSMVDRLREDVLRRGLLENRRLNRSETLTQLSSWCDASGRYARGRPYAQEVSQTLFAGQVIPRMVTRDGQPVSNAAALLDTFISDVLRTQGSPLPPGPIDTVPDPSLEGEMGPPPSSISLERDLRDHIAYDPGIVEAGLRLRGKEYHTDVGRIDVLCEDSNGALVVIELKKDRSSDVVVGQTLRYMGRLMEAEKQDVRGIIIVGARDDRLLYAVSPVPDIKVKYYQVHFEITAEPPDADKQEITT